METDLSVHESTLEEIRSRGKRLRTLSDERLGLVAASLKDRATKGESLDELLVESFALAREAADRTLGMRPYDVQVLAGIVMSRGELVEMQTGEGKTLAAVLPSFLNGLTGRGVHVLTFNDYLARRDAEWMGPAYRFLGLEVAAIQEGMSIPERKRGYRACVTYATAKEAGFDFLRMQLVRDPRHRVHRPFHYAVVDEADSILIDEARVPLVIAGERVRSSTDPYRIAEVVRRLEAECDYAIDENHRNANLTEAGIEKVEDGLACGNLHAGENLLLLTEVNQALHARILLRRDVEYIVRDGVVELVDEFTGRVVDDRRWPDGLQAALEAKEGVPVRPGGRILGSITLQHFLGLKVVVVPPNRPCVRLDLPDEVHVTVRSKTRSLVAEIERVHGTGRPVLVGTASVEESEGLAAELSERGIPCRVLNARNDEREAAIIAQAGSVGAVTISTNMAGRGTDIRLGGDGERERDEVVELGGLYVVGTNRHESRRIDDQLRGRAGRQGDPGSSRYIVSLEDPLMVRYGIEEWIPERLLPEDREGPVSHPAVHRSLDQLQRIVEGKNLEIRKNLRRYSMLVEEQRKAYHRRRRDVLEGTSPLELCASDAPERYRSLEASFGEETVRSVEREITLHHLDGAWEEYLAFVAQLREGIHLVRIGGRKPLDEFHRTVAKAFFELQRDIDRRIVDTFRKVRVSESGIDVEKEGLGAPSTTWTYLVNDRALGDLHEMLAGPGNFAVAAVGAFKLWPLIISMSLLRWWRRRRDSR